jgi:hypothetical protein
MSEVKGVVELPPRPSRCSGRATPLLGPNRDKPRQTKGPATRKASPKLPRHSSTLLFFAFSGHRRMVTCFPRAYPKLWWQSRGPWHLGLSS